MRERVCALMMTLAICLTACGGGTGESEAETLAQTVRSTWLAAQSCAAHLEMTADYGQRVYQFGMDLAWAKEGDTVLTLTAPGSVAGVTARIAVGETALEYDGVHLETGALDPSGLSPVDAAPAFLSYAREGFMAECVLEDEDGVSGLRVAFRDPEKDPGTGTEAQLWFDPATSAIRRGEISSDGVTVIQCEFSDMTIG